MKHDRRSFLGAIFAALFVRKRKAAPIPAERIVPSVLDRPDLYSGQLPPWKPPYSNTSITDGNISITDVNFIYSLNIQGVSICPQASTPKSISASGA